MRSPGAVQPSSTFLSQVAQYPFHWLFFQRISGLAEISNHYALSYPILQAMKSRLREGRVICPRSQSKWNQICPHFSCLSGLTSIPSLRIPGSHRQGLSCPTCPWLLPMWVLGLRKGPWAPGAAVKGLAAAWTAPGAERWEILMRLSGRKVGRGLCMGTLGPKRAGQTHQLQ